MKSTIALMLAGGAAVWAADPTPLDIKTGEWEYTVTMQMGGMPAQMQGKQMPQIPPDVLAKLPPEQRAKMEAAMKQAADMTAGKPTTTTNKNCVKKEDLAKLNPVNDDKSCKMTVLSSSRSKFEAKMDCDTSGVKTTANLTMQALSPESTKFTLQSTGTQNGQPMNMNINGAGKWLSAMCTEK